MAVSSSVYLSNRGGYLAISAALVRSNRSTHYRGLTTPSSKKMAEISLALGHEILMGCRAAHIENASNTHSPVGKAEVEASP